MQGIKSGGYLSVTLEQLCYHYFTEHGDIAFCL